jgi:hypothetical protein
MGMGRRPRNAFAALLAVAAMAVAPAATAETVTVGLVGAISSTHWPIYIGLAKGYFAAEDLQPDLVFIQSSAALVQQLTGGSLDLALSTGLADPLRAIDKGSPIAIVRIEMQAPPYALLAKPAIKGWAGSQGQDDIDRRPQGYHAYLSRAHGGSERTQTWRLRHGVRGCDFGAVLGAAIGRGRCRHPATAVQFLCRVGRLHQSRFDH